MKVIFKVTLILIFLIGIFITYLSTFGVETDKFNNQISNKILQIDKNLEIELKKIRLVLDPFSLKINIKTIGSKLKKQNKVIEIENIITQISIKSLLLNEFSIENLEISTRSLEIKNLISFLRTYQNSPKVYILEKVVKKGYLIADIKLEFNSNGKIKDNYKIDGLIKDTKLSFLNKYNIENLDLTFDFKKNYLSINDITLSLNNFDLLSEKVLIKTIDDQFSIIGNVNQKNSNIDKKNFNLLIKQFLPKIEFEKLRFSSKNNFSFKINKKFEVSDFILDSKILIDELSILNTLNLKNFFPNTKENLKFSDHKLSLVYNKESLYIEGNGNILFQDNNDTLTYSLNEKDNIFNFKTSLRINDNPFKIDFLNFKKNKALIKLEGSRNKKKEIYIKFFSINEKKDKIEVNNLTLNKKLEIIKLDGFLLDYIDDANQKNQIKLYPIKNKYVLNGSSFNANNLINDLLFEDRNSNFLKIDSEIDINIEKLFLDKEYNLFNLNGDIDFKKKQVVKANLSGNFSDDKKLKFTINTSKNNRITTLFIDKAEPIVRRYKFIKGFDEGSLDFYSSKKFDESISQLKIYNFKLKELPVLTKILTLASLQGIADILSGEGIRFDEFEMNFKNKENLITINEIYAIGPAISILMEGYVEKGDLVSLRGTLVPATTINKFIGSLPVLGKILVGSKTGEGVFGVSFKIKGPPKKLETSVNPIKTLTPRFITRTLEKIKKN